MAKTKLVKRNNSKGGTQLMAQQALENEQSQQSYLQMLQGIKEDMYETPKQQEPDVTDKVPEQDNKKVESIQDMAERTKKREYSGELKRIPVDSEIAEVYKIIAAREGVTLSGFISNVLETYLDSNLKEVKSLLKKGNKFLV